MSKRQSYRTRRMGHFLPGPVVERLCRLLRSTDLPFTVLAVRFDCTPNTISNINRQFQIRPTPGPRTQGTGA